MEIFPKIHWVKLTGANVYLCVDEDGLTLIDSGMPGNGDDILNAISRLGYNHNDLKRILVTHADVDHAGSLAHLSRESGATIFAAPATARLLIAGESPKHLPRPAQFILERFFKYEAVSAIKQLKMDETLPVLGGLQPIATPGHTLDHISFFSPQTGVLFVGDALITRRNKLRLTTKRITADVNAAHRSARLLLSLNPTLFACGHGEPLRDHSSDELMRLYQTLKDHR